MTIVGRDVSKLVRRLADVPWAEEFQLSAGRTELILSLNHPVELYQALPKWISEDGLSIERLSASDGDLEALFESLLRHHRGETP